MVNADIEAVFGPVPANTDLSEDTKSANDAAVISLLVIATISVVLRILSRKVSRAGVKADDYMMIVALVRRVPRSTGLPRFYLPQSYPM